MGGGQGVADFVVDGEALRLVLLDFGSYLL